MSYLVLARKYRPLRFADLVGQEHVARTLAHAIEQGRVHHAYLFAGARGLGKTTAARIFAKALVCERGPTPVPCNECTQCIAVNENNSVDVIEIDGASNNSVEDIRSLREQVHYLPQSARRKVYIIDEVHMLTTSAFNALLKTLEEPPPHVNFVFATTEVHKVLATILSRVSRLDFRRLSTEHLIEHLRSILEREQLGMDEGGLRLIARSCGGSVRDAMTMLDQVIAFAEDAKSIREQEVRAVLGVADRLGVEALVDAVLERDSTAVLNRLDVLVGNGIDLVVLATQILQHLRDLTVTKLCSNAQEVMETTASELASLQQQAAKASALHLSQMFDRFARTLDGLPNSRVPRLLLEMGVLDLVHVEPLQPLAQLVERLEQLEGKSSSSSGGREPSSAAKSQRPPPPTARSESSPRRLQDASDLDSGVVATHASLVERRQGSEHAVQSSSAALLERKHPNDTASLRDTSQTTRRTDAPEPTQTPTSATPASPSPAPITVAEPETPPALESPLSRSLWQLAKDSGVLDATRSDGFADGGHSSLEGSRGRPRLENSTRRSSLESEAGMQTSSASQPPTADETASPCTVSAGPAPVHWESLEPFAAWEQLVARVRLDNEFLAAVLSEVGLAALASGVVRVAAPLHSFAHTQLDRADQRAAVEQALRDAFAAPFQLEVIEGQPELPELPSVRLIDAHRRELAQVQAERLAREHPAIVRLLSTFQGEVRAVKPWIERT